MLRRLPPTLLATLLATLLVAAPAHAGRRQVTDAPRDVLKQVGDTAPRPAPRHQAADVTRFVSILRRQELTLSTSVRELPKNFWAMLWQVRTDTGALYDVDLLKTGEVRFQLSRDGAPVECAMGRSVNPAKDRVTITVPLTCLGSPASVRTGAGAASTSRDFGRIFTDDAGRVGAYDNAALQLGRTIRPG